MSGYVLHPEALLDLDEIWEFIAQDDIDAADRVLADFLDTIRALVHFPQQGTRRPRPYISPSAIYEGARLPDRLCTR
jgi:plasmid stabilization system protein ParE